MRLIAQAAAAAVRNGHADVGHDVADVAPQQQHLTMLAMVEPFALLPGIVVALVHREGIDLHRCLRVGGHDAVDLLALVFHVLLHRDLLQENPCVLQCRALVRLTQEAADVCAVAEIGHGAQAVCLPRHRAQRGELPAVGRHALLRFLRQLRRLRLDHGRLLRDHRRLALLLFSAGAQQQRAAEQQAHHSCSLHILLRSSFRASAQQRFDLPMCGLWANRFHLPGDALA